MPAREVTIIKGEKGYGFNLSRLAHVQFIRVVDPSGAAAAGGARVGDRVLAINGQDVREASHSDLVMLIKQAGQELRMTLHTLTSADFQKLQTMEAESKRTGEPAQRPPEDRDPQEQPPATQEQEQEQAQPSQDAEPKQVHVSDLHGPAVKDLRPLQPQSMAAASLPEGLKQLSIQRGQGGFGFNLSYINGRHLLRIVDPDGEAAKAGAFPGDEIFKVNSAPVVGIAHQDVVQLIKQAGSVVELFVKPNPVGPQAQAAVAADPILRSKAKPLAKTNEDKIREAQEQAQREWELRRKQLAEQQAEEAKQRRLEVFEEEKARLADELAREKDEAAVSRKKAGDAREAAREVATKKEFADMDNVLQGIETSSREELAERHAEPLPNDEFGKPITELRRQLETAVLEDEIYQVQHAEWKRFAADCSVRRQAEAVEAEEQHRLTQQQREEDVKLLRDKQMRMDAKLEEAKQKREAEIEEQKRKRDAELKERKEAAAARAAKVKLAAQRRDEARQKELEADEQRRRLEEETRLVREQQEREMAQRNAKLQELEDSSAVSGGFFGVPLVQRRVPEAVQKGTHPMVEQMSKARGAGTPRIPLIPGMSDTKM